MCHLPVKMTMNCCDKAEGGNNTLDTIKACDTSYAQIVKRGFFIGIRYLPSIFRSLIRSLPANFPPKKILPESFNMHSPPMMFLPVIVPVLFATAVLGQSTSIGCQGAEHDAFIQAIKHPNATNSYPGGPLPTTNSTIPDGIWTYNIGVTVNNTGEISQRFWIDTPNLRGVKASQVPFSVCAVPLSGLPRSTYIKAQGDIGDCGATLSPECASAIRDVAATGQGSSSQQCSDIESQLNAKIALPECGPFTSDRDPISASM